MDGKRLTHLDDEGRLKMIDIGDKECGARGARAPVKFVFSRPPQRLLRKIASLKAT